MFETTGAGELSPRSWDSVQTTQAAWSVGSTPTRPHVAGARFPLTALLHPIPPPLHLHLLSPVGVLTVGSRNNVPLTLPSASSIPVIPICSAVSVSVQTTTTEALVATTASGALGAVGCQVNIRAVGRKGLDQCSEVDLKTGRGPKRTTGCGRIIKMIGGGGTLSAGFLYGYNVATSASRPTVSNLEYVQQTGVSGQNPVSDNELGTHRSRRYVRRYLPYNPVHSPRFPQVQRHLFQSTPMFQDPAPVFQDPTPMFQDPTPVFQDPTTPVFQGPTLALHQRLHSTWAKGLEQDIGAVPGSARVPNSSGLLRSGYVSPFGVGEGGLTASTPFKKEKPLLMFNGTRGPEDFERFSRTFEFYIQSRGAEQFGLQLVGTWLEDTPLLGNQQFLRDHPLGSFAESKEVLRANLKKPLDARGVTHKLHPVLWREGRSLVRPATGIRDLQFRAHPTPAVGFRKSYAGDTFIRCLPEKWHIALRDRRGASLTEYLVSAQVLKSRDTHKTEIHLPSGLSASLHGNLGLVRGDKESSEQERPMDGEVNTLKEAARCFCKELGHTKLNCRKFANRGRKTEVAGVGESYGQSSSGRSTGIEEPPVGGPQLGKAGSLDPEIVDYSAKEESG